MAKGVHTVPDILVAHIPFFNGWVTLSPHHIHFPIRIFVIKSVPPFSDDCLCFTWITEKDDIGTVNLLVLLNHIDVVENLVRLEIHTGD